MVNLINFDQVKYICDFIVESFPSLELQDLSSQYDVAYLNNSILDANVIFMEETCNEDAKSLNSKTIRCLARQHPSVSVFVRGYPSNHQIDTTEEIEKIKQKLGLEDISKISFFGCDAPTETLTQIEGLKALQTLGVSKKRQIKEVVTNCKAHLEQIRALRDTTLNAPSNQLALESPQLSNVHELDDLINRVSAQIQTMQNLLENKGAPEGTGAQLKLLFQERITSLVNTFDSCQNNQTPAVFIYPSLRRDIDKNAFSAEVITQLASTRTAVLLQKIH